MQHDVALREAARAIYESVYPGEEWTPVPFVEAERFGTVHYRNAVDAARRALDRMHRVDPLVAVSLQQRRDAPGEVRLAWRSVGRSSPGRVAADALVERLVRRAEALAR